MKRNLCLAMGALLLSWSARTPAAPGQNIVANPGFTGTGGVRVGDVTGDIPDNWRAFAVGGGAGTIGIVPLAADELFPGSPATNAVRWQVDTFGADQGFDNDNARFLITPDGNFHTEFYIRTGNADASNQDFFWGFPLFAGPPEAPGGFLGREPGNGSGTATDGWQLITGPEFLDAEAGNGHISFRVANDGGENAILIAMPSVVPEPTTALLLLAGATALRLRRRRWTATQAV